MAPKPELGEEGRRALVTGHALDPSERGHVDPSRRAESWSAPGGERALDGASDELGAGGDRPDLQERDEESHGPRQVRAAGCNPFRVLPGTPEAAPPPLGETGVP